MKRIHILILSFLVFLLFIEIAVTVYIRKKTLGIKKEVSYKIPAKKITPEIVTPSFPPKEILKEPLKKEEPTSITEYRLKDVPKRLSPQKPAEEIKTLEVGVEEKKIMPSEKELDELRRKGIMLY